MYGLSEVVGVMLADREAALPDQIAVIEFTLLGLLNGGGQFLNLESVG